MWLKTRLAVDSILNSGRIIQLLTGRTRFTHFYAVFNCILQPIVAASDLISGIFVGPIVPDKPVKFHDPCLNQSREIPPEAVKGSIFDSIFRHNRRS